MKLYFYFLKTNEIRREECEVVEKPKTYKPIDGFPRGFLGCYVKKEEIGKPTGYNSDVVILIEDDIEKVSEIFREKCNREISKANNDIVYAESVIKEQNTMLKMINEWRLSKCK